MKVVDHAVMFLEPIVRFWMILNVYGSYENVRFLNALRCQICTAESISFSDLKNFATFIKKKFAFQLSSCENFDKGYINEVSPYLSYFGRSCKIYDFY